MDAFELHLLQEEQAKLMNLQNPLKDAKKMLADGYKPMILPNLQVVWGSMKDNIMVPFMFTSKNAQGIDVTSPVPVEVNFVGQAVNAQLTSMGNIRHENSMPKKPSDMHNSEGAHAYIECNLEMHSNDPMVDPQDNETNTNFNKSKGKQGLTLVAPSGCDDFGARTILEKLFGKCGLVVSAMAYMASQPEHRTTILETRFSDIARAYTADQKTSIYRAVFDVLTGKSNGYHFGYEARGGSITLPVYNNMFYESTKKDMNGKRIKPDNDMYLRPDFDSTGGLKTILKKIMPRSTYRYLKKTDVKGIEIGHRPGDQVFLHNLRNPCTVAMVLKGKVYFNAYQSFVLDPEPDHSGIKILYEGDAPTASEIATFEEWKKSGGGAPIRNQVSMAMTSDLSNVSEIAKSEAMKARRDEFYRQMNGGGSAIKMILPAEIQEDVNDMLADIEEEERDTKRQRLE